MYFVQFEDVCWVVTIAILFVTLRQGFEIVSDQVQEDKKIALLSIDASSWQIHQF